MGVAGVACVSRQFCPVRRPIRPWIITAKAGGFSAIGDFGKTSWNAFSRAFLVALRGGAVLSLLALGCLHGSQPQGTCGDLRFNSTHLPGDAAHCEPLSPRLAVGWRNSLPRYSIPSGCATPRRSACTLAARPKRAGVAAIRTNCFSGRDRRSRCRSNWIGGWAHLCA